MELEIRISQCYFPTQQLDSPMNSEREGGSQCEPGPLCRRGAVQEWSEVPEGGRGTASLRWALSHLWKSESLRVGSSRGLLRAVWRLKCIHLLTHKSLADESHHTPPWPSSSCDPQSKRSVPRSAMKPSLSHLRPSWGPGPSKSSGHCLLN